jgi:BioD-like phosphotransacetylase family protein
MLRNKRRDSHPSAIREVVLKCANDLAPTLERFLAVLADRHGLSPTEQPREQHRWASVLDRVPLKAAFWSSEP